MPVDGGHKWIHCSPRVNSFTPAIQFYTHRHSKAHRNLSLFPGDYYSGIHPLPNVQAGEPLQGPPPVRSSIYMAYIYIYIYVYIYIYIYIQIHVHIHIYIYIYIHTYVPIHMYVCICVYIYIYTHVCIHTSFHVNVVL